MSANLGEESAPKRMCILGGGGYLGHLLAESLQTEGHFCVLFDLSHSASFPNIRLVPELTSRILGSITDCAKLREAMASCESCFHLAGYGMTGGASLEREKCFAVNVQGTRRVLEECRRSGVRRLVFTSSVAVIFNGTDELHFVDEERTPYTHKFLNAYAETKLQAEKDVLAANCPHSLTTCALRLRGIYGPGEVKMVRRTAELALKGIIKCNFRSSRQPLTQYSSGENCVQALILAERALRKGESPAAGKKYHILDGGPPVDPFAFWYPLISALGCPLPSFRIPYALVLAIGLLSELLYKWFGLEPLFTRFEIALCSVTNTYSIERARRDLGYAPVRNHDLGPTIELLKSQLGVDEQKQRQRMGPLKWVGDSSPAELAMGLAKWAGYSVFVVVVLSTILLVARKDWIPLGTNLSEYVSLPFVKSV